MGSYYIDRCFVICRTVSPVQRIANVNCRMKAHPIELAVSYSNCYYRPIIYLVTFSYASHMKDTLRPELLEEKTGFYQNLNGKKEKVEGSGTNITSTFIVLLLIQYHTTLVLGYFRVEIAEKQTNKNDEQEKKLSNGR